ncbi:MAG TPA: helicase C-terminal domain-containing protein [Kouleothrix sp.]|uniref:helicase C-terminal domain-containing protein n=1 Tax=Kouleothrix sp. TaxID=2779161 RepID=UPI002BD0BF6D|nr:helicase C-terminal domain-containing protein [Kouleothrix sp.]HRC75957.1 helicase C-terminal domain-containing protein [Kouleothrix sp.]
MDRTFIAIDVETTGLEAGTDEIIEIAAVKFNGSQVLETFQRLVKPRHSLPLKITRLTGISDAMLADAPRFPEVAPDLVRFVKTYPLIGHSVGFDLKMLQAQGMRFPQTAYDTFDMATLLMPHAPAYRLGALAAALGIAHDEAHRALSDADVTRQVFLHLLARIEALDLASLAEISRLTAKLEWPLRDLFGEIERTKAKNVFLDEGRRPKDEGDAIAQGSSSALRPSSGEPTPLKPTGNTHPLDVGAVRRFFAPDGALGQAFDGYEQRGQQVTMAEAVAQAFNQGEALMVEAGTGTGKGMAYLVPAAMFAARRGERVVISTNTINLQDQLFFKDIPALQRIMTKDEGRKTNGASANNSSSVLDPSSNNLPFTAALLKGRGNYLCLRRYKDLRRDGRLVAEEIKTLLKVQLWLPTTTSGDKAELLLMDKESAAWGRINATPETCTGARCPDFRECFFFKARRQAEAAHLVVVNHALMLADLATEAQVLPAYDHIIIDEAHNLEEVATDQFGFSVDQARLLEFLDNLFETGGASTSAGLFAELPRYFQNSAAGQADMDKASAIAQAAGPAVTRARQSVYDCFNLLTAFMAEAAEASAYDARLRVTDGVRKGGQWEAVERAWENLALQLNAIGDALGKLDALLGELENAEMLEYDLLLLRVQSQRRYASDVRVNIGSIINGGDEQKITWITYDRTRDTLALHAAPLSVAELLEANLFSQKATVALASATMAVNGDFGYVKERIGLTAPEELQLDSPFDYQKQALVYIPNDIPEPNQRGYQQALEQALIDLCTATGGRALVLFTANSALRQTYKAIQEPLEEQGIAVLGQGIDGSRRNLLERFKEFPRTVLLGTTSFWEGVDVVGDALSVLVIAKLPFSVPNDPIYTARSEGFADAFNEYAVPQAILRFKQGFGRLIRSREDRGIVAVLDKRLLTKKYGQVFLDSLPHTTVRSGPAKHLALLASRFLV